MAVEPEMVGRDAVFGSKDVGKKKRKAPSNRVNSGDCVCLIMSPGILNLKIV